MPSTSGDLFRAGRLREAIEAQSAEVRAAPSDIRRRWFLVELLCFAEEWERADRALEIIAVQAPRQQAAVLSFQHLLRGEEVRRQVMNEGRAPEILGAGGTSLRSAVAAMRKHFSSVSMTSAFHGIACSVSPIPRKPPVVSTA